MMALRGRGASLLASAGLTLAVLLPVAFAAGDHGLAYSLGVFVTATLAAAALGLALPYGPLFSLALVVSLAVYTCVYVIIGRSAFPALATWAEPIGFALPVAAFVLACLLRRRMPPPGTRRRIGGVGGWLMVSGAVAVLSLSLPLNRLPPGGQTAALLGAMVVVAATSAHAHRAVITLLAEIAAILGRVVPRLRVLAAPIATFALVFALLSVGFGSAYRLSDALSQYPLFQKHGAAARIEFLDAMHFSVVTMATVGYGDILPVDDGVRLLATIQMVLGQILLLFGFAEIMRSAPEGQG